MTPHWHVSIDHLAITAATVILTLFLWNKTSGFLVTRGGSAEAAGRAMADLTH